MIRRRKNIFTIVCKSPRIPVDYVERKRTIFPADNINFSSLVRAVNLVNSVCDGLKRAETTLMTRRRVRKWRPRWWHATLRSCRRTGNPLWRHALPELGARPTICINISWAARPSRAMAAEPGTKEGSTRRV